MPDKYDHLFDPSHFKKQLWEHGVDLGQLSGWLFSNCVVYIVQPELPEGNKTAKNMDKNDQGALDLAFESVSQVLRFGGARVVNSTEDEALTHVVGDDRETLKDLRRQLMS